MNAPLSLAAQLNEGPKVLLPFDVREGMTIKRAADKAGVAPETMRLWCECRSLGRKIGGQWRVSSVALEMYLNGDEKALRAYLTGVRHHSVVSDYYRRLGLACLLTTLPFLADKEISPKEIPKIPKIPKFTKSAVAKHAVLQLNRGMERTFSTKRHGGAPLPRAADYVADLELEFGNVGFAVAAYSWGCDKLQHWLQCGADPEGLPAETRSYVESVTSRPIESWLSHGALTGAS